MARTTGSSGERTLALIRARATEMFARHGYAAFSMRDLGAAVGVGAPALYRYFPTKQALLLDLFEAHFTRWAESWALVEAAGGAPAQRLDAFIAHGVRFQIDNRLSAELVSHEWRALEKGNLTAIMRMRGAQDRALRDILRDGHASGAFRFAEITITAVSISQIIAGIALWHRAEGGMAADAIITEHQRMAAAIAGAAGGQGG